MFSSVDTIWVLLGTVLVFFMQAGFAMVETGFTRAKNAGNIIMKNLMDFSLGTVIFTLVGFGLMYGGDNPFIGTFDFFIQGDYSSTVPSGAFVIFQIVFCATAATIVSGAMAERTNFLSYCLYSVCISLFIYPISGHWIWGGGWLQTMGFHDFAGSTAVHMVGGVAAFVGAKILGPRLGKYNKDGSSNAIPGHSLTLGALGVFILWFCWFGFNGGSTLGATGDDTLVTMSNIFVNTNLAAAVATTTTMIITWLKYGKPDVSMTLNGSLAGLVAITAGCDIVGPLGAAIIGIIAGFAVVFGIEFVDQKLKIDDPVGAVGVHGINGALGTILVGFFALDGGLFYGGGTDLLVVQVIGVIAVIAWVAITMFVVFKVIDKLTGLRVSEEEEIIGLDLMEHGLQSSYADFVTSPGLVVKATTDTVEIKTPLKKDEIKAEPSNKITKVVVVCNPAKLHAVKDKLESIGVTGMTVTNTMGFGIQKGQTEYYRGAKITANLLPKIKIEIIISAIPTETVVEAIEAVLYTGNTGDGKIFIYDVENVIRVSTGQTGYDALQDK